MIRTNLRTIAIILGTTMILSGSLLTALLLTNGGPILPHIIGPIVLVGVGVTLLIVMRKTITI